jgi:DNA repair photolyase
MSAMATHDKNTKGVQEELLRIIQLDEARELIESMVNRMAVIEEAYHRIRELREAVQPYIPEDSEHDEEYWLAAYLIKPHASTVIEKFRQLREIQHKLAKLEGQLQEMNRKESYLEDELGNVDSKQENMGESVYKLVGKDADPYVSLGDSDLYDLLYESIHEWAAKQLSTERS